MANVCDEKQKHVNKKFNKKIRTRENIMKNENIETVLSSEEEYEIVQNSRKSKKLCRSKPKVLNEWHEGDIRKLITYVEAEPSTWDVCHKDYSTRYLRNNAWRRIAERFEWKFPESELNAKWSNLRIQYRSYSGQGKTKSGQRREVTPKWKYFKAMSFVRRSGLSQTPSTSSNLNIGSDDSGMENNICIRNSTAINRYCGGSQSATSTIFAGSSSSAIADVMRDAVTPLKECSEKRNDPNSSFAAFIVSELRTLSNEDAAFVRSALNRKFIQSMDELARRKL